MSTIAVADAVSKPSPRVRTKTTFYVGLSLFMAALVVIGFWPSYYGQVLRGAAAKPLVIHLHGAVFTGWMVLLVAQVLLAWRGRVRMHRRVGTWGIAYGVLVLAMGLVVAIAAPVMHVNAGEWTRDRAAGFLLITFGDMVLFGSLFGAAVVYRRKPEIHKRLMLGATVALMFAAVGRIPGVETVLPLFFALWLSPVFIGMLYDWRTRGRPHVAYVVSAAWLTVVASRVFVSETEAWLPIGRAILAVFV
jgi:hypothetical protein